MRPTLSFLAAAILATAALPAHASEITYVEGGFIADDPYSGTFHDAGYAHHGSEDYVHTDEIVFIEEAAPVAIGITEEAVIVEDAVEALPYGDPEPAHASEVVSWTDAAPVETIDGIVYETVATPLPTY